MKLITQNSMLIALSRMMGKRTLPQGDNLDWKDYIQTAFDYAWRYYKWDWTLRQTTVDLATTPYLPEDFDLGGYREAVPTADGEITELTLSDYARQPSGLRTFALEFDTTENKYKVLTKSGLSTISFVYQTEPPTIDEDSAVPFPSSMTVGIGASIYAKQGENPTRANIDQEWDEFHAELDRHVGRMERGRVRGTNLNLQDTFGTYTGDTRH